MTTSTVDKPTEIKWTPNSKLTRKQNAFIRELVTNPKLSATQAVEKTYNTTSKTVATSIAHENLTKPDILLELSKYQSTAELTLIEVMNTSKEYSKLGNTAGASYASVAMSSANAILDRLLGKPTTRIEQSSTSVTLNIDLSSTTSND